MGRKQEWREIAKKTHACPRADDCTSHDALFGQEHEGGRVWPCPHPGGESIDDYCILVLAQNPHTPRRGGPGEPKLHAETVEGYLIDRVEELKNHVVGDVVEDMGLKWEYLVWDNVVKCPTKNNQMNNALLDACTEQWLETQLDVLDPEFVIAMGSYATGYFGWEYDEYAEDHAAIYHYAYLMRTGAYKRTMKTFRENVHPHLPDRTLA